MLEMKQRLNAANRLESLHDAQQIKEEAQQMFDLGLLDLESKRRSRRFTGRSRGRSSTCTAA